MSWPLSTTWGIAVGSLFVSLTLSPGGRLLAQAPPPEPVGSAAETSLLSPVETVAEGNEPLLGPAGLLAQNKRRRLTPLAPPSPPRRPAPSAKSSAPPPAERQPREEGVYKSRVTLKALDLSRTPTEGELRMAGQLGSALSPVGDAEPARITDAPRRARQAADNLLMGQAMQKWNAHAYGDAVKLFRQHRRDHPDSPWAGEAELHLGCEAQFSGNWEQARLAFERILLTAPAGSDIYQKALLRRAILHVEQGQLTEAKERFAEMLATETKWEHRTYVHHWLLTLNRYESHEVALRACGSAVIAQVLRDRGRGAEADRVALLPGRSERGYSLGELTDLAREAGLGATAVRADVAAQGVAGLAVPFVAHYRDRHYVVVNGLSAEGRVRVYDPRLQHEVRLLPEHFVQQWSGLAVVFGEQAPEGLAQASAADLSEAVGGCCGLPLYPDDQGPPDCEPGGGCSSCRGMPQWYVNPVNLNVVVQDVPLWYDCGFGPKIDMELTYNSQDALNQLRPFGNKWVFNYTSYAMESPNSSLPQGSVLIVMPGGRGDTYRPDGAGGYVSPAGKFSKLTKLTAEGPYEFRLETPDGTVHRYGVPAAMLPAGTSSLLKSMTDRHGNTVEIIYSSAGAIQKVRDPLGRDSVFSYNAQGMVARIEDPFGRQATFTYDAAGNLTGQTDMGGVAYGYTYDGNVYLTSIVKPTGTFKFLIEPADHVNNGSNYYPSYGGTMWENSRVTVTHPDGYPEEFYYNGYSRYGWHRDKVQFQSPLPYDQAPKTKYDYAQPGGSGTRGMITRTTYEDGKWVGVTDFNGALQGQTIQDENGGITRLTFNPQGQMLSRTDARGNTTSYAYMANGFDLWKVTDAKKVVQQERTYHPGTRDLATSTDATNRMTQITYNARGQANSITNAANHTFTLAYDYVTTGSKPYSTQRVTTFKQGSNVLSINLFDELARTRVATDADGLTVMTELDNLDRVRKTHHPDGTFEENVWGCCYLDKQIDRLGNATTYGRDYMGRPLSVQDAAKRLVQYRYDANGSLTTLLDGMGNRTKWNYDGRGHVIKKTYADDTVCRYVYDGVGNLKERTDAKGVTVTYGYNSNNGLEAIGAPGISPVNFTFDPLLDRLASMTDGTGTTSYNYDAAGRLTWEDGPLTADAITTEYDALGRVRTRTFNNDAATTTITLYDDLGRLQSFSGPLGTFTYGYRSVISFRMTSMVYPNGQTTTVGYYGHDRDDRVSYLWHRAPDGDGAPTLSRFDYDYDAIGQITRWGQQAGDDAAREYALRYDPVGQLLNAVLTDGGTPAVGSGWRYDKAGNRVGEQVDNVVSQTVYNSLNQATAQQGGGVMLFRGQINEPGRVTVNGRGALTRADGSFETTIQVNPGDNNVAVQATDASGNVANRSYRVTVSAGATGSRTPTHDLNGNLTDDGERTYEWDALDRLTAINTTAGNLRSEFTYDGWGRRAKIVEKAGGNATSTKVFVFTGFGLGDPAEERDAANTVTRRFFAQGEARISGGATTKVFYTHDHLGSVRELIDNAGAVQARYDYGLWGQRIKLGGSLDTEVGYTGYWQHQQSGYALSPTRPYSPVLGRFVGRDPIEENGGINLYAYCNNRVTNFTDRLGLQTATDNIIELEVVFYLWMLSNAAQQNSANQSNQPLTRDQIVERAIERESYKKRCTERPPPGLSYCDELRWKLQRNKDCKAMREAFGKKWFGDNEPGHVKAIKDLNTGIKSLEDEIASKCQGK